MAYIKTAWADDVPVTYANLAHCEEQYGEIMTYLAAHDHDDRYYPKADVDSFFWDSTTDGDGSELDADTLEGVESADIVAGADVGIGGWWYGTMADFTDGYLDADPTWHICDGAGGSIDLREDMIIGAGGDYNPGESGGSNTFKAAGYTIGYEHILTAAECMHTHVIQDHYAATAARTIASPNSTSVTTATTSEENQTDTAGGGVGHPHTGTFTCASTYSLLPPFIALIPIQKVA